MNIVGTLRIDGVLYNLEIRPLSGEKPRTDTQPGTGGPLPDGSWPVSMLGVKMEAPPMPPPAQAKEPARQGAAQPKTILLLSYEQKSGVGRNSKPYTLHKFMGADQKSYATFRQEIASLIRPSVGENPITLYVEPDNRGIGYSILSVAPPERQIV